MTESPRRAAPDAPGSARWSPELPVAFSDPVYLAAVVDLLGVIAYGEMSAFERLAEDAKMAPTLQDKAELARMASTEFAHFEALRARLGELGADPFAAMEPFVAPFDAFHARTAPADWLEGLVKAYVGDGLAADFYREIAAFLDADTRGHHLESLADAGQSRVRGRPGAGRHRRGPPGRRAARAVGPAADGGGAVAGAAGRRRARRAHRAAGRRRGPPGMDLAAIGRLFTRLTENHSVRMEALGLSA